MRTLVNPPVKIAAAGRRRAGVNASLRVFQIFFESWHLEVLEPEFEPFDNRGRRSELREFEVFERLAGSDLTLGAELWGALSWRFSEKTGMSGREFIEAIERSPGYDVYYCNPFPNNEALFHNLWLQGETAHPRFKELCSAVFAAAGLPEADLEAIYPSEMFSTANYIIGNEKFWSIYIPFVKRVLGLAEHKLAPEMRRLLHSSEADAKGIHAGATYVAFIVERLFSLFMKTAGRRLKGFKVSVPGCEGEMNVHLRLLREMKDVAHQTKSPWLAACWANYRNLYLNQVSGPEWCQTYLRAITPTDVVFA